MFPLCLLVILDGMFWMRLYDVLIFLFVQDSLLIDIAEVSNRIQVFLFRCFLVVINPSAYFSLSVGIKPVELLLEVEQTLFQELANTVKPLRVSPLR